MKRVATYCYQCVAGPDLLTVKVADGVAKEVEPNFAAADVHPGGGKVCVKAYGLVQKTYHPDRVLHPMKRTNPKKGHGEDPGFVPISWDEALDTICAKLAGVRSRGLIDESGYPRVGTPNWSMMFVNAQTPKAVQDALFAAATAALKSDGLKAAYQKTLTYATPSNSIDEARTWLKDEMARWKAIMEEVKIDVEQ